ncbi:helix-turn-helix domain-containing protein [Streptomyces sp. NPDC021100]|uniref:helix-turn-helix domain-containing protein n=1 Tax=Streptomyces sp. NPDC021100 TaxID=3365114 RepID=UPI0037B18492
MTHVRHRHTSHFTVVGNHLAQHRELSLVAIGIGVYVQSLPDGANVGIKDLTRRFREGEITIARGLRELEQAGYLRRERVRTEEGRVVTLTRWHERPGARTEVRRSGEAAPPVDLVRRQRQRTEPERPRPQPSQPGPSQPEQPPAPEPLPPPDGPAADLLAGLRRHDPRLLLSEKDVRQLSPAVRAWLERGVGPRQIIRTLTAELPVGRISRPARLLRHRLTHWLPPALPTGPLEPLGAPGDVPPGLAPWDAPGFGSPHAQPPAPPAPLPLRTCDGCERAVRAAHPGALCRDCRESAVLVGADGEAGGVDGGV